MTTAVDLGGDCQCGRGPTIGTCYRTRGRLLFRAFHDGPANYHLANAADWRCVDCIAGIALMIALATDEVRDWVQQLVATQTN